MAALDSMNNFKDQLNESIKNKTQSLLLWALKIMSSFFISYTLALVGSVIMEYGRISLFFVVALFMSLLLKLMKEWSYLKVLVFSLIVILLGLIFKMYILIAP